MPNFRPRTNQFIFQVVAARQLPATVPGENPKIEVREIEVQPLTVKPTSVSYSLVGRTNVIQMPKHGLIDKHGLGLHQIVLQGVFGTEPRQVGLDLLDGWTRLVLFRDRLFRVYHSITPEGALNARLGRMGGADLSGGWGANDTGGIPFSGDLAFNNPYQEGDVYMINFYDLYFEEAYCVDINSFKINEDYTRLGLPAYTLGMVAVGPPVLPEMTYDATLWTTMTVDNVFQRVNELFTSAQTTLAPVMNAINLAAGMVDAYSVFASEMQSMAGILTPMIDVLKGKTMAGASQKAAEATRSLNATGNYMSDQLLDNNSNSSSSFLSNGELITANNGGNTFTGGPTDESGIGRGTYQQNVGQSVGGSRVGNLGGRQIQYGNNRLPDPTELINKTLNDGFNVDAKVSALSRDGSGLISNGLDQYGVVTFGADPIRWSNEPSTGFEDWPNSWAHTQFALKRVQHANRFAHLSPEQFDHLIDSYNRGDYTGSYLVEKNVIFSDTDSPLYVAEQNGLSLEELMNYNPTLDVTTMRVGDIIKVPVRMSLSQAVDTVVYSGQEGEHSLGNDIKSDQEIGMEWDDEFLDLKVLGNGDTIAQDLNNILITSPGEHPLNIIFGFESGFSASWPKEAMKSVLVARLKKCLEMDDRVLAVQGVTISDVDEGYVINGTVITKLGLNIQQFRAVVVRK